MYSVGHTHLKNGIILVYKLYPLIYSYACSAVYNLVQPSSLPTVMLVEAATEPLVTMYDEAELVLDVQ